MATPRFYIGRSCSPGDEVALEPADLRHVALVLRLRAGDCVTLVADGSLWAAELTTIDRNSASARILRAAAERSGELPVEVTVLQALPKGAKFDEVVEKCVELGARRIVPVIVARSVGGADDRKVTRWRRIARSAAQQSQRLLVPVVEDALPWLQAIRRHPNALVACADAKPHSLAEAARRRGDDAALAIAVGPEGGFTQDELTAARDAGADLVSLGPSILRTETAAAALLSAIASRYW